MAEIAQLWTAQPGSLSQVWWLHCRAGQFLAATGYLEDKDDRPRRWPGAVKWLRWAFGAFHLVVTAVTYFTVWATRSPVGTLAAVGGLVLLAWHPW